ncbi:MAG TPA: type VI secretion system baseplate subunit TssG [Acetobacteraceae bacterium]|nr:type VI secretion system baseplate subunit TssG [Acetobacteraceae bacterium]
MRQRLLDEPSRFTFDAAYAVLRRAAGPGAEPVRFHAPPGLAFTPADVLEVRPEGSGYGVLTGLLGLTGPAGVMPRPYTEMVNTEQRRRSPALAAMLDLLAQRPMAQLAASGTKYQPHRAAAMALIDHGAPRGVPRDGLRGALLALTGYAIPGLSERLSIGEATLLFYAGAFARRPRSAERLAAILSDWLGQPVEVEQFVGSWIRVGPEQRSSLPRSGQPGRYHQLGVDAAAGGHAWDIQSRVMLRVGPLGLETFKALLPGQALLRQLCALAGAYLDGAVTFAVNPVLAAPAVPIPSLATAAPSRLGWDTWLPVGKGRSKDAADAVFTAGARSAPE